MTREEWLERAVDELRGWYDAHAFPVPERVRVSVGWPRGSRKAVGQCWKRSAAQDGNAQVFISPALDKASDRAMNHRCGRFKHG